MTRNQEDGSYNLGIYRGIIKAADRIVSATDLPIQHLAIQWEKARRMGKLLEAAVFIGGPPALLLAAASKVPCGVDEFGLAGALNGAPVPVVQAETFDALVPAIRQPWQALWAAAAFDASLGKYFIAVNSDIDLDSLESIIWAVAFSTQPQRDAEIIRGKVPRIDPSVLHHPIWSIQTTRALPRC